MMNSMVGMSAVLGIAAVALGIVLIPGPNMFYLASRSITQGRGAGLIQGDVDKRIRFDGQDDEKRWLSLWSAVSVCSLRLRQL